MMQGGESPSRWARAAKEPQLGGGTRSGVSQADGVLVVRGSSSLTNGSESTVGRMAMAMAQVSGASACMHARTAGPSNYCTADGRRASEQAVHRRAASFRMQNRCFEIVPKRSQAQVCAVPGRLACWAAANQGLGRLSSDTRKRGWGRWPRGERYKEPWL